MRSNRSISCPDGIMSLFEQHRQPEPELDGRALRDLGMEKAADHADQVHGNWQDAAYEFLKKYIGYTKTPFMGEDVRRAAELAEGSPVPTPPSKRAWGAVLVRAATEGLIKKKGYGTVTNPLAHRTPAAIWIAA